MTRALRQDMPGPDWRISAEDLRSKGFAGVFSGHADSSRLVVEIGFGGGEFLLSLARRDPQSAHLGIEVSAKRVLKTARRLARTDLANVRLLEIPAQDAVRELIEKQSLDAVWINFPDPWPKKRHEKRRLIAPPLVRELADRLRPGGLLQVATDHAGYAEAIDGFLVAEPMLENANHPRRFLREVPGRPVTKYEIEWRIEGRSLFFWTYRRCCDS